MKFDIIIPVFNTGKKLLTKCIQSVLDQTHQDWECYFVDGGSTDLDKEVLHLLVGEDPRFHYARQSEQHLFAGGARNQAIEMGSSAVIATLDSDDYWYPDHLEALEMLWDEYPAAAICWSLGEAPVTLKSLKTGITQDHVVCITGQESDFKHILDQDGYWMIGAYVGGFYLVPSNISFSRSIWKTCGGFPEIRLEEDSGFQVRMLQHGNLYCTEEVTVYFNWGREGSICNQVGKEASFLELRENLCQHLCEQWKDLATDWMENHPDLENTCYYQFCEEVIAGEWRQERSSFTS